MQSIYKQLRGRLKFGAYRNKVDAKVFILSYSNSCTSYQFWEASILLPARLLHGANHSFKHQHATAGSQSRKLSLSHFTPSCTKSLASFLTTLFHDLRTLLVHTTDYSWQSPPSHSQCNYTHKSAFLDGVIAVNLYTLKRNFLKKFYTVYLKFLFSMSIFIYIYTHTHAREVTMQSTISSWANGFLLHE